MMLPGCPEQRGTGFPRGEARGPRPLPTGSERTHGVDSAEPSPQGRNADTRADSSCLGGEHFRRQKETLKLLDLRAGLLMLKKICFILYVQQYS